MDDPSQSLKNFYKTLSKKASEFIVKAKMREHSFVLAIAVLIGLVGGFGAVGIQFAIREFQQLFWSGKFSLDTIKNISWYWKIIVPTFGGLFVGLIIQFYSREAKGHGVPEVMEAITLRNGIIRPRVVIAKLIASAVYIASGGSVGREGPVIQIGSAVGSTIGQFFRVNAKRMRIFVACGAASGIAAAFNAPVAGALFAVEIILGDFAVPQFSPVVIASVSSTVISRHFLGNYPAFRVPVYQLQSPVELLFYLILGIFSAAIALLFIKTLYSSEAFFDKNKLPAWVKTSLGGALIGFIGLLFPQIFGVGYDTIEHALSRPYLWQLAIALVFIKIFATSISLGSGGSGGIFAPSLFLGAMLGSFFGSILSLYFPDLNISPGAYALVGMGGVVAAATHGPITAILIIFEMSGEYKIILPLMITCIIATVLSMRLHNESIYTLKLKLRGINLYGGHEINVLKSLRVVDAYKTSIKTIPESAPFTKIVEELANSQHTIFYVSDKENNIIGSISLKEIRQTISDYEHLKYLLIARDIMNPNVISVSVEENLDDVMKKFGRYNLDELPVISFHNGKHIIGTILRHDVIEIYNRQIFLRDMSGELSGNIKKISEQRTVHVFDNYHLVELEAPMIFWNKSLKEIQLRTKYGSDVILIKKKTKIGHSHSFKPDANYRIAMGDILLIFGEKKSLEILEKL
jgi:CIC family chloride channel protein